MVTYTEIWNSCLSLLRKRIDEETFKTKVKQFFYSIGDMNSYKVDANYEQIEENIENDFLDKENKEFEFHQ